MTNINVGINPNDGLGNKLRDAFIIVNDNFASIDTLLSGSDVLTISQITGLQTALNNINNQLAYIPLLQQDVNDISSSITSINNALNSQNVSIIEIQNDILDLQTLISTKIDEAPIDGNEYVRKDGAWSVASPSGISEAPIDGTPYVRQDATWIGFTPGISDAPVDGYQYVRKDNSWIVANIGKMIEDSSVLGTNTFTTGNLTGYGTGLSLATMYPGYFRLWGANTSIQPNMELRKEGISFRNGTSSVATQFLIGNSLTYTAGQTFSLPNKSVAGIYNLLTYDLGTGGTTLDYLQFSGLTNSGRFTWNDADGTADLTLKGGNVTLQLGQEQLVRVVNKTATNITLQESAYQAVRVTGAQGNRLKVDLALATNDLLSAETIGLVTETIDNNQEGFVTISGLVRGINTTGSLQGETWADGDILYLSPTVAGQITKVKPVAPQHLVVIGYVVRAHITQGSIFVKVNNGYELDELHNVRITGTPSNRQVLMYNNVDNVWVNGTVSVTSFTKLSNQTLIVGSWSYVSDLYEYTYTNANITTNGYVTFIPNNSSVLEVTSSKMLPQIITSTGSCKLFAQFPPQENIVGEIIINS